MLIEMGEEKRSIVEKVEKIAKLLYPKAGTHGWEHVERVIAISLRIASEEKYPVDEFVLRLACLLHDVSRRKGSADHAAESAEAAEEILKGFGLKKEEVQGVKEAILSHSFSGGRSPRTLEGAILSDADKIDALGAVGIARVFEYSGENGRTLEESVKHFYEKILKLPSMMLTLPGKSIAEERAKFVKEFLSKLEEEISFGKAES